METADFRLDDLAAKLKAHYPKSRLVFHQDSLRDMQPLDEAACLVISNASNKELGHLTSFYLIASCPSVGDLALKLVAFNGAQIDSCSLKSGPQWGSLVLPDLVDNFCSDRYALCRGVSPAAAHVDPHLVLEHGLLERNGADCVIRSRRCRYAVLRAEASRCTECQQFGDLSSFESGSSKQKLPIQSASTKPDDLGRGEAAKKGDDLALGSLIDGDPVILEDDPLQFTGHINCPVPFAQKNQTGKWCATCDVEFHSAERFKSHLQQCDANSSLMLSHESEKACVACGQKFSSMAALMKHMDTPCKCKKMQQRLQRKRSQDRDRVCQQCHQTFATLVAFRSHLIASAACLIPRRKKSSGKEARSLCPICGKVYYCLKALEIHMGCIHGVDNDGTTPVEQHVCHVCGNSYGHKWRLNEHVYRYHKNPKRIQCDLCDKVFHNQNKLVTHKVAMHLKMRPFQCPECDYQASEMSNVYKHCQKNHGYRAKGTDVRVNRQLLKIIREKFNYDYFGKLLSTSGIESTS